MAGRSDGSGFLTGLVKNLADHVRDLLPYVPDAVRSTTEETSTRLRKIYERTSSQVLEKTEETRKTVRLRMAILDIEHHLNRLYPDIGKTACELWDQGKSPLRDNKELRMKVESVKEYRARRTALNAELSRLQAQKQDE